MPRQETLSGAWDDIARLLFPMLREEGLSSAGTGARHGARGGHTGVPRRTLAGLPPGRCSARHVLAVFTAKPCWVPTTSAPPSARDRSHPAPALWMERRSQCWTIPDVARLRRLRRDQSLECADEAATKATHADRLAAYLALFDGRRSAREAVKGSRLASACRRRRLAGARARRAEQSARRLERQTAYKRRLRRDSTADQLHWSA